MDPQQNVSYGSSGLAKNPVSRFFAQIKNKWTNASRKKRLGVLLLIYLLIASGLLVYIIRSGKSNLPGSGKNLQEILLKQVSEGFERLKVPGRESPYFTLTAKTKSIYGIFPQEVFVLSAKEHVDKNFLEANIASSVPVKLTAKSDKEYEIVPKSAMGTDEVLNISLAVGGKEDSGHTFDRNYGWTFQTQGKFRVKGTIPGDKKTNVPLNTGIEFTFSQDDFKDPGALLTVEPSIKYRTEIHGEVLAIVPLQPLEPETIYTVTLRKGLDLKSRTDPISEDHSFTFQTQSREAFDNAKSTVLFSINDNFIQVSPNETAVIGVNIYNWQNDAGINTKIYKFKSGTDFIDSRKNIDAAESSWYTYYSQKDKVPTDGLSLVGTADLKIQNKEDVDYLQLPSTLGEGFYLILFTYDGGKHTEQLWLQSSFLSAYVSAGRKQTLVWLNNLESHLPVDTAFVTSFGTDLSAVTNDKGISVFDTPSKFYDAGRHYLSINSSDGKSIYIPVNSLSQNADGQKENRNDYWSYLYHERLIYKTGDTLYFWGIAKKRDGNTLPDSVTVSIPSSGYGDQSKTVLATSTVTPNSDGSFTGSLSLAGFSNGWYSLELKNGDLELTQSNFSVTDYTKPDMKIEMAPDKNAIFAGESVKFTGKVTFFDETPVKAISLKVYSQNGSGTNDTITTNEKGLFEYDYKSSYSGSTNYYPRVEGITVNPALSEESTIEGYGSVWVYGAKLMLTTKGSQDGHTAKFQGTVNKVDLTGINNGSTQDARGDVVRDKEIKIVVTKTWWETKEDGTYYDFVEKTTRPTYKYIRHEEKTADTSVRSDGQGEFSYNFDMEDQRSYQLSATVTDDDGHKVEVSRYYYYYSNGGYGSYQDDRFSAPEITLNSEENSFSLGQTVDLSVKYKGKDYSDTDQNRFLFILAERGTQKAVVEDKPKYSFEFTKEHVPNVYVASVIFTGNHYELTKTQCNYNWRCSYYSYYYDDYYFNGLQINYKQDDSKLDLKIVPDNDKYAPGDTAKIKINVTKSGSPVDGADVNLIVVDAALEAIGGVKIPSILPSVYAAVPSEIYYNYYSHKSLFSKPPAAEMGGGGGPREIFKDTAFFGSLKTDTEGNAVFEFKLPDNLTTWNIYTQSVNTDLFVGQTSGSIIVTKDFFVTSNFPRNVLTKDKVFVTANSFGSTVGSNEKVNYEFYLTSGDKKFGQMTGSGTTSKDISFQVPQLTSGDYKATLSGKFGDLEDILIYPLKVSSTRLDFKSNKVYSLTAGNELTDLGLTGLQKGNPIKLVITDSGKGKFYHSLYDYCYVYSNRLEKRIAKMRASQIISDRFNEDTCKVGQDELSGFQNFDGGLSQVSWGGSDLKATVWTLYVDRSVFDKEKVKKYLENMDVSGNAGSIQKIYVDWGLTLLGVPKITDLRVLAGSASTFEEKVIAALALSSAGETELSRELYFDVLADYGYTNKPYIRIQRNQDDLQGSSTDQLIEDSAYALLLGSITEPAYNEGIYSYLRDYRYDASDVVIDLSKMAFIDQELSKVPDEDTQVSIKTSARNSTFDLKKGGRKALSLTDDEIQNPVIRVNTGKAEINAIYNITTDALSAIAKDERLKLKRTFKNTSDHESILPGDIVEVTVDFNLDFDKSPRGGYEIKDYLPSGLVFLDNPYYYGFDNASWVYQTEPNVIRYTFYNSPWWQRYGEKSFTYYARAAAVGTYVAEPATMQSKLDLSVMVSTPEESVTIKTQ